MQFDDECWVIGWSRKQGPAVDKTKITRIGREKTGDEDVEAVEVEVLRCCGSEKDGIGQSATPIGRGGSRCKARNSGLQKNTPKLPTRLLS